MIAFPTISDGPRHAKAILDKSTGRIWPVIIGSLLLMNASIVATTVYFAASDKSVATEPDYYAKAVDFDATMRMRQASGRLGWAATPVLRQASDGRSLELSVALTDRAGQPLTDAAVTVDAFSNVRSGERQRLFLSGVQRSPGAYAAPIMIDRPGVWNVRIVATRQGEKFVRDAELFVPDLIH